MPIAGLGGVSKSDGLTSQTFYDDDLTGNVDLDSSAGLSAPTLGGGTYNISIAKVADTPANGGADVSFGNGSDGAATVTVSTEEEIPVTIVDGMAKPYAPTQPDW